MARHRRQPASKSYEIRVSIPRLGALGRVIQAHAQDCFHVIVRELVIHMLALSAARDEPIGSEQTQPLGHGRHFFVQLLSQFGDAMLAGHQQFEKAQAALVAGAAKESRCAFDDSGRAWLMLVRLVAARIIRM